MKGINLRKNQKQMSIDTGFFEKSVFVILKKGLAFAIPFIMTGSIILILNSFPIASYQEWLAQAFDGKLRELYLIIYDATLGILSLVMLLGIGYYFGLYRDRERLGIYPILSVCSYVAFVGLQEEGGIFGFAWLFIAIVVSMVSCEFFRFLITRRRILMFKQYTAGADSDFNLIMGCIFPAAIVIACFGVAHLFLTMALGDINLNEAGSQVFVALFENLGANLGSAVLFVTLINGLWFMGLHGSNMLEEVAQGIFESGMQTNQALIDAGAAPTEIYTKTFIDSFVMMGGCGTVLCLVIALLIAGKSKNTKKLVRMGALPAIFNINEIFLFGLPVIYNPYLLIPFITVPVVITLVSAFAVSVGLVPIAINAVQWTTPPVFSGYVATGSAAGSVLQVVNIVIGVLIYLPFVRMQEKNQIRAQKKNIRQLTQKLMISEEHGTTYRLMRDSGLLNSVARGLALELKHALDHDELELFYQPQVKYDGDVYGAEALLRWNHPVAGYIYPPLIIQLAREDEFLEKLDNWIFERACRDAEKVDGVYSKPIEISVNILPSQLENPRFYDNIKNIYTRYDYKAVKMAIEMTEQVALISTPQVLDKLKKINQLGIDIIMDDFGMGHSSMTYLQNHELAAVKLDGKLIVDIMKNDRSNDIVSTIGSLASKMNIKLFAEFVETEAQKERLAELGCFIYQGWLYSKAIPFDEFVTYLEEHDPGAKKVGEQKTDG